MERRGYQTPEEAVLAGGGWPEGFATVVGSRIQGDEACVWLLTNDRSPFEEYECVCVRKDALWHEASGYGGFAVDTPHEITEAADQIRARSV
jgi:hypothetical protein